MIPALDTDDLKHLMSGEHDAWYAKANALLQTSKRPPWGPKGWFPVSSHVETKYAAAMKEAGIQHSKVVINNNNGVCNKQMNCTLAVESILPEGWTMEVYYPGDGSPLLIKGKRVVP